MSLSMKVLIRTVAVTVGGTITIGCAMIGWPWLAALNAFFAGVNIAVLARLLDEPEATR